MTTNHVPLVLIPWLAVSVGIGAAQEPKRHCRPAEWPKRLPALDAVVDSAALLDFIDPSAETDTTSMVVSILYREDGPAVVRLVEPAPPSPAALQFLQIMSRGLRRMPPPSPMGALRVRVWAGPGRGGTVSRSVYCPPEVSPNGPVGSQVLRVELNPHERPPPPGGRLNMDVQTFIDETGQVTDVRLISGSGLRELDQTIVVEQQRVVFLPATIDGIPVPSWTRSNGTRMRL